MAILFLGGGKALLNAYYRAAEALGDAPVVAVLLAVKVKMLVVAPVEVNEAVTPLGRPEATRLMVLAKPPVGFTVIVLWTLLP